MKKYLLMIVMLVGFAGMAMAQHRPPVKHHRHHYRHHRHVVHHRP